MQAATRQFIIVGHKAATSGDFSLSDMPGSAGRIDILARSVTAAFLTSFSIRRDTRVWLVLLGEPDPPKSVRFEGSQLKYLNPDERSTGALIKKALKVDAHQAEECSMRGIYTQRANLQDILRHIDASDVIYLHEEGIDVREATLDTHHVTFVLGDHLGLLDDEEGLLSHSKRVSVGPVKLHTDHCITIVHNELDRLCLRS
ncbi:MAG: tRNA (pseudouridine(54)-N(1))-methyltransferase TrmY [Halobacteriota archaeon]